MWALAVPYSSEQPSLLADTPWRLLAALGGWLASAVLATGAGWVTPSVLGVTAITAGHGALLGTALAWWQPERRHHPWLIVALLGLAAGVASVHEAGAILYLAPCLAVAGWRPIPARRERVAPSALLAGALAGSLLGGHLLVSAARTLGYRPGVDAPAFIAALAYDAGANVLAAECFFRGALFDRLQRRWSFAAAAAVATGACLVRYLADPLLPRTPEILVGALFYLALLGVVSCWLFRWSGSLAPGLVAALVFFAAYRLIHAR